MTDMENMVNVNDDIDTEVTELNNMIDNELEPENSGVDWKVVGITVVGTLVAEHILVPKIKKLGAKAVSGILGWLANGDDNDDDTPKRKRKKRNNDDAVDVDDFVDDNDDNGNDSNDEGSNTNE